MIQPDQQKSTHPKQQESDLYYPIFLWPLTTEKKNQIDTE